MNAEQTYIDLIDSIINPVKKQIRSLEHQIDFDTEFLSLQGHIICN